MAHRRPSKHTRPARPLRLASYPTSAVKRDGRWVVRRIRAGRSTKDYRCPECDGIVSAGTAHVVAWPHTPPIGSCWERRP